MHTESDCHKELASVPAISFFAKMRMWRSIPSMRSSLLIITGIIFLGVSCAKKEPQTTAVATVKPKTSATAAPAPSPADDEFDLASQLREPDLLNRIDTVDSNSTAATPQKNLGSKPIVIKGDAAPILPTPPQRTPEPPIGKPELPAINGANTAKSPGSEQ